MPEPISCAVCGATDVPLALSSKSGFKRRVCASVVGCRKRQETNRAIAAAEARGRQQMIEALRVVPAPLISAVGPNSPPVTVGRDRIVIRSAADVLIAHMRTDIRGCHCGWAKLGHSHAQHVVDELASWLESCPPTPRS